MYVHMRLINVDQLREGSTVFPRNLAAATFNFVVQFGAATFRGRPDFEGGD